MRPDDHDSTLRALNNAQNSLKSGARSNELSPQEFNGRNTLGRSSAQPVLERAVGPPLLAEARHRQALSIEAKFHELILVERRAPASVEGSKAATSIYISPAASVSRSRSSARRTESIV